MIRGESDSDQKMASEADLATVELLCGSIAPAVVGAPAAERPHQLGG